MNKHTTWLAILSLLASLAQAQQAPESEWRQANRRVAEFPRGHADVLKWEQQQAVAAVPTVTNVAPLRIGQLAEGVRLAWQAHPELARSLNQLGAEQTELLATGQWQALSLTQLRRVEDAAELIEIAHGSRKVLLAAVAATQAQPYQHQILKAAEAASELGERMAKTGNWSQLQAAQRQLIQLDAQQQWQREQYAVAQNEMAVLKTMQQWARTTPRSLQLPTALPELPVTPLSEQAMQSRLAQVRDTLPQREKVIALPNAEMAYRAYRTAHALASKQQQILTLKQFVYDETVLRYNGMLMNTWELLDEARALAEARVRAINATRDFWLAEADLQLVLLGGQPESFVTLAAGSGDSPAAAGH